MEGKGMGWTCYEVVFRLRSPLYIGERPVGNLMVTRRYVPSRVLLGALTAQITRKVYPSPIGKDYWSVGEALNRCFRTTYFFVATRNGDNHLGYQLHFPWEKAEQFPARFLSSYVSTQLDPQQGAAAEGSLHEVEFISPYALDNNEEVFLKGYVFLEDTRICDAIRAYLDPQSNEFMLREGSFLQLGGERGYGWGKVEVAKLDPCNGNPLFGKYSFALNQESPTITIEAGKRLPLHLKVDGTPPVEGMIEPLYRRQWHRNTDEVPIAYLPGARAQERINIAIQELGYGELLST